MAGEKAQQLLKDFGFSHLKEKNKSVTINGRLAAVLEMLEKRENLKIESQYNQHVIDKAWSREDEGFCGGSFEDLVGDLQGRIDLSPFNKARERFSQSDLASKLKERFEKCQPRRQRVKSEYDGEFNESRRWDIQPFDGIHKAPGYGRSIDFIAHCAVNSRTGAEQLNLYGATVWALVDIIEECGVNVRLILRYCSNGYLADSGSAAIATFDIEAKKAGEYVAPSLIASALKSNFFRRPIFALTALAADSVGQEVDMGLGSAKPLTTNIEFKEGQLITSPNVSNASFPDIERELLKIID